MMSIQRMIIVIFAALLVTSCSTEKKVESTPQVSTPAVSPTSTNMYHTDDANEQKTKVILEPIDLPNGYQAVEATLFKFVIPKDWNLKKGANSDSLIFQKDGKDVGETETLGWFNSESWMNIKPNHADQTDFQEIKDIPSIGEIDAHIYRIQLTHTKPAAENNPDWKYNETRWYVTIKEKERSYGFYFSSDQVDVSATKTILSSFRLKS